MDNSSLIGFLAVIVSVMSLWISLDSLRRARKMDKELYESPFVTIPVEYVPGQSAHQMAINHQMKQQSWPQTMQGHKTAEMVIIDFIDGDCDLTVGRLIEFYTAFPEYEYHLRQAYHLYCMDGNGRSGQSIANQVLNPDAEMLEYE